MKQKNIRFFSPEENTDEKPKKAVKSDEPVCVLSASGRLVFPGKTLESLNIDPNTARFKVGTEGRKRTFKTLYLVPDSSGDSGTFALTKTGRGYSIPMKGIFQKVGVDFEKDSYTFTVDTFPYGDGVMGYELTMGEGKSRIKPEGSRRGRKKKVQQ